ncbi:MAG: hypothetical protein H7301_04565 [Cryobacterium sp.]|nr:hypothetical protein [Oligoflexia bacterium]
MKKQNLLTSKILGIIVAGLAVSSLGSAIAEESTGEKIGSEARDTKVTAKKHMRKGKKKVRDATGNHSTTEDMKDGANNAMDSTKAGAEKLKDKVD